MADDTTGPRYAISAGLARLLKTIDNPDNVKWFDDNSVYEYPNFNPAGYPSAMVIPSNIDSEFDTVQDNMRTYQFFVILIESGQTKSLPNSYSTLRQLEDDVINAIDNDYTISGVNNDLSSDYQLIDTDAIPSAWQRVTVRKNELLMAQITVRVKVQFNLS